MKREKVRLADIPALTSEDMIRAQFGDPAKFLRAFAAMKRMPTRGEIGFDHEALAWISKAWNEAASAAVGDTRLRDACLHERDRYKRLEVDLKNGEHERGDSGIVFLNEARDWPPVPVILGAIEALEHIGVTEVMQ